MKKVLVVIALMGFGFSASADHTYEIQINGGLGGTAGSITLNDDDTSPTGESNTPWSLGAEVYKTMGENMQFGGILQISDADNGGDTAFTLGALGRYNFDADHRNSMFAGGGLTFSDMGDTDFIALHLQFGKRYALSDTITYTPNISYRTAISGEDAAGNDVEGSVITINLLSFSGFM